MKTQTTITTNTTTLIATVIQQSQNFIWQASIGVNGTFGGVAVAYYWSPDGGSTLYPITSAPGTPVSSSAADSFNIQLGTGNKNNDQVTVHATTTGGSGTSIIITVEDNR